MPAGPWNSDAACKEVANNLWHCKTAYIDAAGLASEEMRTILLTMGGHTRRSRLDLH